MPPDDFLFDGVPIVEACRRLEEEGAAVVGLNCGRGPATMVPLLKEIKKVCKVTLLVVSVGNLIPVPAYYANFEKDGYTCIT